MLHLPQHDSSDVPRPVLDANPSSWNRGSNQICDKDVHIMPKLDQPWLETGANDHFVW